MALDFPNSPSVNDSFSAGGKTWVYNGTKWVLLGVSLNQTVADGAITTAKIADSAITASKIADGTIVAAEIANNAVTTAKILDANVTQAKLGTTLSAVTVTTAANRDTAVASPFTGQLVFLTDTKKIQVWDGTSWLNITLAPPETPTSLSATALSDTSISIAFTAGGANGSPITNYKYALSTNGGSTYGAFTALDPADATSPITISELTEATSYYFKLKAINDMGESIESDATTITTPSTVSVNYLVVAGGGGGANVYAGGGGAGGIRSTVTATGGGGTLEQTLIRNTATNYTVTIGSGGTGAVAGVSGRGNSGNNSVFSTITSVGGGGGGQNQTGQSDGLAGGSGGGAAPGGSGGAGTANQGRNGGNSASGAPNYGSAGGGGAGAVGSNGSNTLGGSGGAGVAVAITGSSVTYGGGGGGGTYSGGTSGSGGSGGGGSAGAGGTNNSGTAGTANTGGGGGASAFSGSYTGSGGAGGSGIVVLRYPNTRTITIGAGLTGSTSTDGSDKVTTITAGSGNVSWA